MRYSEIKTTVASKKIDKRAVRNAVRAIRSKKADTASRYEAVVRLPAPLDTYFARMRLVSHRSWDYIADRMENTVLAKRA